MRDHLPGIGCRFCLLGAGLETLDEFAPVFIGSAAAARLYEREQEFSVVFDIFGQPVPLGAETGDLWLGCATMGAAVFVTHGSNTSGGLGRSS